MYSEKISAILKEIKGFNLKEVVEFVERIQSLLDAYHELEAFMDNEPPVKW